MVKRLTVSLLALVLSHAVDVPGSAEGTPPPIPEATIGQYEVVGSVPHDPQAFTQGLAFRDGSLYESTGLYGKSTLRRVDPRTGTVLRSVAIPERYFAEGIAILGSGIYLLTWREEICLVFDVASLEKVGELHFEGEGWGLADDGKNLILSDGTDVLRVYDPTAFRLIRRILVRENGLPVTNLNELEYIHGEIYAAVWMTDRIVRIDPESGNVNGSATLRHLYPVESRTGVQATLNGIAYDRERDRIFITGKLWPTVLEFGRK